MRNIFDLPFNHVMRLYQEKLKADLHNNIYNRTRMLRLFPQLFDNKVICEIERIQQLSQDLAKYNRKKPLRLVLDC